jgi:hypothetical protein
MNINQNYAYHLDNLRREHGFTIEKFCAGIVNPRNYSRYLSGERTITTEKINAFCNKLKISQSDFYYSANERDRYELKKINKLYEMIEKREYKSFLNILDSIKKEHLVNIQNERYLSFCVQKYYFDLGKKSNEQILKELCLLSDYPNCLSKHAFDFVDLISLQLIAEIEIKTKKTTALDKLTSILEDHELIYISSESSKILPSIYSNVALFLSRLKEYKQARTISIEGIEYSLRFYDNSGLTHLYYVKFYSEKMLNYNKDYQLSAIKCLMSAVATDNQKTIKTFYNVLKKDLNSDPFELIISNKRNIIND